MAATARLFLTLDVGELFSFRIPRVMAVVAVLLVGVDVALVQ